MKKLFASRTLWAAAALALGLGLSTQVYAVTMTIVPSQTLFLVGGSGTTAELTVNFFLGGVTGADQVVKSFDQIVAYNPQVLKYRSASVNQSVFLSNVFDSPPFTVGSNYLSGKPTNNSPVLSSALGGYMGTPYLVDAAMDYYEGSIRVQGASTADGSALLNAQSGVDKILFSVVFDVVLDQCARSSIVLLDDKSFLTSVGNEVLDLKNASNAIHYFTMSSPNSANIQVPVPGTIALLGAGLIGLARRAAKRA